MYCSPYCRTSLVTTTISVIGDINCSSHRKQHTSMINFLSSYCCLKTAISKKILATCYSSVTTGFFTYLNTAVSVTRVTFTTFSLFICLEFLLLHSCGCQLISDEYEWMTAHRQCDIIMDLQCIPPQNNNNCCSEGNQNCNYNIYTIFNLNYR